ncbi:MAG TPA: sugar phosphate nucleotidyltransferase [Erysipelotrichaceae bacterium]|nr:sugar phosphate nucleotidyltransferase [Erysipelotrichaceae bacterium]
MREVIILAAGEGTKFWPYQSTRNKCMFPIANKPLIAYTVEALIEAGIEHIIIVSKTHTDPIRSYFKNIKQIEIIEVTQTKGSAESFVYGMERVVGNDICVLFGDCLIQKEDLIPFIQTSSSYCALVSQLREHSSNWIACQVKGDKLIQFGGHQRGNEMTHHMAGFTCDRDFLFIAEHNPNRFTQLKVGVGSPFESFIEESLNEIIKEGKTIKIIESKEPVFDCDKPWHALEANAYMTNKLCGQLTKNTFSEGSFIDDTARVEGYVQLGTNSKIGHNVWIKGNVIIGDNTIIENGVILEGNIVIGDECTLYNHCKVHSHTVIGNRNKFDQGFEFLSGVTLDHVYCVHYGEYYGLIGENTDLGAGTTSGTLRFDDQLSAHYVKGRKELPSNYANASYLGDYCRTGVGALLMPGVKVGAFSVVGSGVVLQRDVRDNTLIYVKQELIEEEWGVDKYGW